MELKHLRYFVAAVEEGSLLAAAERLAIAQPALSRRIQDLEAELGCALLTRSVRGVTPTGVGDWSAAEDAACRKAAAEDPFPTAVEAGIPPAQPVDD